ncbi:MAG: hypothetical protein M1830_007845 [Pleopsidium flavum]|nr:MAG: hypothetical protein M1830_007845 [Pleopsidium flavum]
MSNYPPTPSFGGRFSVTSRLPSSNSVVAHNDRPRSNRAKSALHMPPGAQSTLAANAYSFNANAQAMNLEAFRSGVPPPPFLNFPHGSLPPPPFPPVPIPQNGFPAQFPILIKRPESSHISMQNSPVQRAKRPPPSPQDKAGKSTQRCQVAPSEADREEGELSDWEVKATLEGVTNIARQQPLQYQVREPKLFLTEPSSKRQGEYHASSLARTKDLTADYEQSPHRKNSLQLPSKTRSPLAEQLMRPRDHGIALRNHRPKETHPLIENRPYGRYSPERRASHSRKFRLPTVIKLALSSTTVLQSRGISPASQNPDARVPSGGRWSPSKDADETYAHKNTLDTTFDGQRYGPVIGKSVKDIRKLAKSALLGLLPHSIRYADLLAAGVDEGTLRSLYEEVGVKVPPQTHSTPPTENMGQNQSAELPAPNGHQDDDAEHHIATVARPPPTNPPSQPNSMHVIQPAKVTNVPFERVSATSAGVVTKRPEEAVVATSIDAKSTDAKSTDTKSTDAKIVPSLSSSNLPTVDLGQPITTSASKTLERKDYIARMLAAKIGKLPPSLAQSNQAPPVVNSQSKILTGDLGVSAVASSLEGHQTTELPAVRSKTMDAEAIKQAQTNLARQKMEALKNRTLVHREPSAPLPSESQIPQPALPNRRASESSTSAHAQKVVPGQSSTAQSRPESNNVYQSMLESSEPSAISRPDEAQGSTAPFPSIPGLFMTSATLSSPRVFTPHSVAVRRSTTPVAINPVGNPRKRPLAADLNDLASNTLKRPFGQTRQIEVVIDVSEDEAADAEDSEMDFEDAEKAVVSRQSQTVLDTSILNGLRNPLPVADIAIRKPVAVASALNTPSAPQTPGTSKQPEDLKTREEQIQLMHLKIAELEQRRKSKQTNSRAETPGTPKLIAAAPTAGALPVGATKKLTATEPDVEPLIEGSNEEVGADKLNLAEAPAAEKQNTSEQQQQQQLIDGRTVEAEAKEAERAMVEVAEQKRRRKAEIEFGLPILDAEVERTQRRLEEMKNEMYRLEAEVRKGLEGRKSLIEELESLGIDTEGMPLAELQAKKDEIMKEQQVADKKRGESTVSQILKGFPSYISLAKMIPPSPAVIRYSFTPCSQVELNELSIPSSSVPTDDLLSPPFEEHVSGVGLGGQADSQPRSATAEEADRRQALVSFKQSHTDRVEELVEETAQDMMDISRSSAEEGEITDESQQDMIDEPLAPDNERETSREQFTNGSIDAIAAGHYCDRSPQSTSLSMEDEYAPDPAQLAPADDNSAATTSVEAPSQQPLQEFTTVGDVQKDFNDSARCDSLEQSLSSDDFDNSEDSDDSTELPDSDIYEPPEPTSTANAEGTELNSPPYSLQPSDTTVRIEQEADGSAPFAAQAPSSPVDLLQEAEVLESVELVKNESSTRSRKEGRFVPYESPLKQFKAYRYHPNYMEEVPGGFRSMTYSHNINSDMPVCRYEAAGGICNDSTCDSQHFRDMGLSDDMILVQMGSVHEGRTPEERDEYVSGLKQIIQDMRGRKVKDFNTVASEIAAYRTRFLKDTSRILLL